MLRKTGNIQKRDKSLGEQGKNLGLVPVQQSQQLPTAAILGPSPYENAFWAWVWQNWDWYKRESVKRVRARATAPNTKKNYGLAVLRWLKWWETYCQGQSCSAFLVREYLEYLSGIGYKIGSINVNLSIIRNWTKAMTEKRSIAGQPERLFDPAVKGDILDIPSLINPYPNRGTMISEGQWRKILRAMEELEPFVTLRGKLDRAWYHLMKTTGLRGSSIARPVRPPSSWYPPTIDKLVYREGMGWAFQNLWQKGGGIVKETAISDEVKGYIDEWCEAAGITEGIIFRSIRTTRNKRQYVVNRSIGTQNMSHRFKTIRDRAGVPDHVTLHSFRHTFITNLIIASGGNLLAAAKIVGHKNVSSTQRYEHVPIDIELAYKVANA